MESRTVTGGVESLNCPPPWLARRSCLARGSWKGRGIGPVKSPPRRRPYLNAHKKLFVNSVPSSRRLKPPGRRRAHHQKTGWLKACTTSGHTTQSCPLFSGSLRRTIRRLLRNNCAPSAIGLATRYSAVATWKMRSRRASSSTPGRSGSTGSSSPICPLRRSEGTHHSSLDSHVPCRTRLPHTYN